MNQPAFVLLAVSDAARGNALIEALRTHGDDADHLLTHVVTDGVEAVESLSVRPPDVLVVESAMGSDRSGGHAILREAASRCPDVQMIAILPAKDGSRRDDLVPAAFGGTGACDVVVEPVETEDLVERINRAVRRALMAREARFLREQADRVYDFEGIVGISEPLLSEIKRAKKLARSKCTVLIFGETGTGKELFARAIHIRSPRAGKPFKVLNCAAVSDTLLESELFGHVKGAFTGAVADRKGLIRAADGGTVFLDEIGDMPLPMQAKLLRTLENGEVIPVGSSDTITLDVRFVAATNRNLSELVKESKFREDLFYRLHAYGGLRIPPLRKRPEDIPILVDRFIQEADRENDLNVTGVTPEALRCLLSYDWPGNVRELRNVVERMVIEAERRLADVCDLPPALQASREMVPTSLPNLAGLPLDDVVRLHIINTLRLHGGNREKTAKALGIGTRTLYRKLKDYGLSQ